MNKRFKTTIAVFLILEEGDKILLQKRNNTGYMDGFYDCSAAGHLEADESFAEAIIREAKEEIGIIVKEEDLTLISVTHSVLSGYIRFFFVANKYEGVPRIAEKDKCNEIIWVNKNQLPDNVSPNSRQGIQNFLNKTKYSYDYMEK